MTFYSKDKLFLVRVMKVLEEFCFSGHEQGDSKDQHFWNWYHKESQDDILWNEISLSPSGTTNILSVHSSYKKK